MMFEQAWLTELSNTIQFRPRELTEGLAVMQASEAGRAFVEQFDRFTASDLENIFRVVEATIESGTHAEKAAAATGFLEALLDAWDSGFDLQALWPLIGSASRKYCIYWNRINGVESPAWMGDDVEI